eukprot:8922884-Alexandrium_andersonii.AAC.1
MTLGIAHCTRAPAAHLMNWLQQKNSSTGRPLAATLLAEDLCDRVSPAQEFVYSKASSIQREYDHLFSDAAYESAEHWGLVWVHVCDETNLPAVRAQCVLFALEGSADFCKRVTSELQQLEWQLLWLVYERHFVKCPHRKRVAAALLGHLSDADARDEAKTPFKLASCFEMELNECVRLEGQLNAQLYNL